MVTKSLFKIISNDKGLTATKSQGSTSETRGGFNLALNKARNSNCQKDSIDKDDTKLEKKKCDKESNLENSMAPNLIIPQPYSQKPKGDISIDEGKLMDQDDILDMGKELLTIEWVEQEIEESTLPFRVDSPLETEDDVMPIIQEEMLTLGHEDKDHDPTIPNREILNDFDKIQSHGLASNLIEEEASQTIAHLQHISSDGIYGKEPESKLDSGKNLGENLSLKFKKVGQDKLESDTPEELMPGQELSIINANEPGIIADRKIFADSNIYVKDNPLEEIAPQPDELIDINANGEMGDQEFGIAQSNNGNLSTELPDPTLEVDTNEPLRAIDDIARMMGTILHSDETQLEVQVYPKHLGKIILKVSMVEGGLMGSISAGNEEIRNVLQSRIDELETALGEQGLEFASLDVNVDERAGQNSFSQGHYYEGPKINRTIPKFPIGDAQGLERNAHESMLKTSDPNRIDYLA